jgi:hypothetical protein
MGGFGKFSKNFGRGSVGGGASQMRDLTDVGWVLPTEAETREVLTYNGEKWAPSDTPPFLEGGDTGGGDRTIGNKDSYALNLSTNNSTRMQIKNDGFVGIGASGADVTHKLTLPNDSNGNNGKAKAFAWATYSSRRYKEDIQLIKDPVGLINKIDGVTYKWKDSGYCDIGFVAEDVGKVIPCVVDYEENGTDAIAMDYTRLNAVIVEAVKQQDRKLEKLINLVDTVHSMQKKKLISILSILNPTK